MITVFIAFLLTFPILHPHITVAQPNSTQPAACEYQEKRESVPINPKTNKPYAPDERNQEPFDGGSIHKDEIKECLKAKIPIKNHHIVFEDYRAAWKELAEETGDYGIQLFIEGGIFRAKNPYNEKDYTGGIRLWDFRDPNVKDGSSLTEEERKAFRIEQKNAPIALIHSQIHWNKVFIDSAVIPFSGGRQNTDDILFIIFSAEADFRFSTFSAEADFFNTTFSGGAYFRGSIFSAKAYFLGSTFSAKAYFFNTTFSGGAYFRGSMFSAEADFRFSTFNGDVYFRDSIFSERADFRGCTFSSEANFNSSTFSSEANFDGTRFKNNADSRDISVDSEPLVFDNTTWEKRIDLRRISVKDLRWDSTNNPSDVKGVVDLRDAQIGSAIVKEVRFQDLVDFSRITVGQLMHFENNTFEHEADFLHIKLPGPIIFIRNRFRSTLDLTGTTFELQKASFCLSYNRINRLVFEPEHLGIPPGIYPHHHFKNLRGNPLEISRVRMIQASKSSGDPECSFITQTDSNSTNTTQQDEEPLNDIYKTLGKTFREANDLTGINEAWYLETVARRAHKVDDGDWVEWLLLDVPSRPTVDVWRSIWISVFIMAVFYVLYLGEFVVFEGSGRLGQWLGRRSSQKPREIHTLRHEERHRAFRMRLFEPIHSTAAVGSRTYVPWRDAAALSARSFLKIGLGTVYPNTCLLKFLTTAEWLIGAYMLVHFVLALKNNLPSIAPFLGVVN